MLGHHQSHTLVVSLIIQDAASKGVSRGFGGTVRI